MAFRFSKIFEQLLKEISVKNLGLFPGKFKPPHRGHFDTAKKASANNDLVFVLISEKPHEGFTAEQSFKIWNIYRNYIPNLTPFITTPTPVLGCYDIANILNNGEFKSILNQGPRSNIMELIENSKILESFINVGNNININLYSSEEDKDRFKNIFKPIYFGKSVIKIGLKPVSRITSASKFRKALTNKKNIDNFLPSELSKQDKEAILNILNDNF